jgi:hypothetical protein
MKALSLYQPWASLMAVGAKRIETRSWSTDYRGLVAIHAAKRFQAMERNLVNGIMFREALYPHYGAADAPSRAVGILRNLPLGCFVAVGRLVDCKITSYPDHKTGCDVDSPEIPDQSTDEFWFGDYSPRRFMWVFDEIWKLREPVYERGHQGLWPLSDQCLLDGIEKQLPESYRQDAGECNHQAFLWP